MYSFEGASPETDSASQRRILVNSLKRCLVAFEAHFTLKKNSPE